MKLHFNENGNLSRDIILEPAEFETHFSYNPTRKKLIQELFEIAKTFATFGCTQMYIDGSFVTEKKIPGDIDVAFDITEVEYLKMKEKYPEYLTNEGQKEIKKRLKLDIFLFGDFNDDILVVYRKDRAGNEKGLVKMLLKDLLNYDKKRKTI